MKISSEHINNLLAYARERHGAPCRVELSALNAKWLDQRERLQCVMYWRDIKPMDGPEVPLGRILI